MGGNLYRSAEYFFTWQRYNGSATRHLRFVSKLLAVLSRKIRRHFATEQCQQLQRHISSSFILAQSFLVVDWRTFNLNCQLSKGTLTAGAGGHDSPDARLLITNASANYGTRYNKFYMSIADAEQVERFVHEETFVTEGPSTSWIALFTVLFRLLPKMLTQIVNQDNNSNDIRVKTAYNGEIMITYIHQNITLQNLCQEMIEICRFTPEEVRP